MTRVARRILPVLLAAERTARESNRSSIARLLKPANLAFVAGLIATVGGLVGLLGPIVTTFLSALSFFIAVYELRLDAVDSTQDSRLQDVRIAILATAVLLSGALPMLAITGSLSGNEVGTLPAVAAAVVGVLAIRFFIDDADRKSYAARLSREARDREDRAAATVLTFSGLMGVGFAGVLDVVVFLIVVYALVRRTTGTALTTRKATLARMRESWDEAESRMWESLLSARTFAGGNHHLAVLTILVVHVGVVLPFVEYSRWSFVTVSLILLPVIRCLRSVYRRDERWYASLGFAVAASIVILGLSWVDPGFEPLSVPLGRTVGDAVSPEVGVAIGEVTSRSIAALFLIVLLTRPFDTRIDALQRRDTVESRQALGRLYLTRFLISLLFGLGVFLGAVFIVSRVFSILETPAVAVLLVGPLSVGLIVFATLQSIGVIRLLKSTAPV